MKHSEGFSVVAATRLLLFCGLLASVQVFAQPKDERASTVEGSAIASILRRENHPYLHQPIDKQEQRTLQDLYFLMSGELLWLPDDDQSLVPDVFGLLERAADRGLRPDDYDFENLKLKWRALQAQESISEQERALFDSALSLAAIRYLADLQRGRIRPQSLGFHLQQSTDYASLIVLLIDAIQKQQIAQLAEQVEPDYQFYRNLKAALQDYRDLARHFRFPTIVFNQSVEPDYRGPQISVLRHKLFVLGLLDEANASAADTLYQGALVEAVKRFQRLHGLNEDGVIGKKTLRALNVPLPQRVRQIELALERFRWLPRLKDDQPLVFVNIPAFRLWAYRADGLQDDGDLSMKVVVGLARRNRTPIFMAKMSYLEFGPYWNVPENITVKEILPQLQEGPGYLAKHNMELVPKFGKRVEPQVWSEESLELLRKGEIKIRQRPGPKNSLGKVKFIFPNRFAVYMHDTPIRKLFRSERRDFSHGCVRVEEPQALAEFMLHDRSEWREEKIQEAMLNEQNQIVSVKSDIAVLIFYSTALAVDQEVYFFEDIYGYDEVLSQALYQQTSSISLASVDQ